MGFSASKFDSAAAAASGPSGLAAVLFVLDRVPGLRRDARGLVRRRAPRARRRARLGVSLPPVRGSGGARRHGQRRRRVAALLLLLVAL